MGLARRQHTALPYAMSARDPVDKWVPACAGMTPKGAVKARVTPKGAVRAARAGMTPRVWRGKRHGASPYPSTARACQQLFAAERTSTKRTRSSASSASARALSSSRSTTPPVPYTMRSSAP